MDVVDVNAHRGEFFHEGDQIVYVIEGDAIIRVAEEERRTGPGGLVMIPAGTRHHVRSVGRVPLFVLTVYAPPEY